MVLYKDNPKLKYQIVTTVQGDKEYRKNCKYIKGKFYVKDRDCVWLNTNWYRLESDKIAWDHEEKKWKLKSNPYLIQGVIGMKNNKPELGYFIQNPLNNCRVHFSDGSYTCINADLLNENFFENVGDGEYYHIKSVSAESRKKMMVIRNEKNFRNKGYNIEDNHKEFTLKKELFKSYTPKISREAKLFSRFLGDISYGLEIETSEGNVPDHIQYRGGVVACRDGSIQSAEYVTIPMTGAKGLQNIKYIGEEITKRCNIDIHCSFHIHIGNIPDTRDYLSSLYVLGYKIQDDVFKMFPYYKTAPGTIKRKNYCQKLKKLGIHTLINIEKDTYQAYVEDSSSKIFTFLSNGIPPGEDFNRAKKEHPEHQKWDRVARYYWLNTMNMVFSKRGTAEFRVHGATMNPTKMINWLFICNAIVKYADKHMKDIFTTSKKIDFVDVLNYYREEFPNNKDAAFLSDYLIAYYKDRVAYFEKDFAKGDHISAEELEGDKTYTFEYKGVTSLV